MSDHKIEWTETKPATDASSERMSAPEIQTGDIVSSPRVGGKALVVDVEHDAGITSSTIVSTDVGARAKFRAGESVRVYRDQPTAAKTVTVVAEDGRLSVSLSSADVNFEDVRAELTTVEGRTVLDCGRQRADDGTRIEALVTVGDHADEIEELREASAPDDGYSAEAQAALDEAAETGEVVVINTSTTNCNDSSKECSLDRVSRVATPDGEIETRRTHTY